MSKFIELVGKYANPENTKDKDTLVYINATEIEAVEDESDWREKGCRLYTKSGSEFQVEETYQQVIAKIEVANEG